MKKNYRLVDVVLIIVAVIVAVLVVNTYRAPIASGSTIGFINPRIATSSTIQVGPQQVITVFATSTGNCYNRVIGTAGSNVMLSFSFAITPTGSVGFPQAASTTVNYTNGDYGCGPVRAYAFSSTTITKAEFNQ